MKKDLTLLIPTRGRPQRFDSAVTSALKHADVDVLAYVDEDDPERQAYIAPCTKRAFMAVGPRVGTAKSLKKLVELCETDWMMAGSDDTLYETPEWDQKLIKAIPKDGIGISYPSDGRDNQCNHFVFHRKMFDLMGLWPDVFWHFGPDGYLGALTERLKRKFYVKDVLIRHLHPKFGLGALDRTFVEARSKGNGRAEFDKALKSLPGDLETLKKEIERCASIP